MILGIQFRNDQKAREQEQVCIARQAGIDDIQWLSACDASVDWANPATLLAGVGGVVLGGSGEFDFDGGRATTDPARATSQTFLQRLEPMLAYIFEQDVPTFGICYGHQVIGVYAGARVWNDLEQKKTGTYEVRLTAASAEDPVFGTLTEPILTQYGHKDSLDRVPDGAMLLMEGADCHVSALRYQHRIYTTQFHPELTAADMIERLQGSPDYLPEGVSAEEVIKDDPRANALLRNFVDKIVRPSVL